jgi:DNA repair photolyase
MRWDSQRVEREKGRSLPGLDVERVRTFDAPEALGINFHEVRAKSALNKVPGDFLPFNYTVNAFRGCAHACNYCLEGNTPILMADGRSKRLADLEVGDLVYGTVRLGNYRRYEVTEVLAHWQTRKDAYRITLEDGTELVASGDHRLWSRRGKWKYIVGAEQGRHRRPHLTLNDQLVGVGQLTMPPNDCREYRRGYLCGLIRGDAYIAGTPEFDGDRSPRARSFRLALIDIEPLIRARRYLDEETIETRAFLFQASTATTRPLTALGATGPRVSAISDIIAWPRSPESDWCKGFLAGIFDAEGSFSQGVLRIANTDPQIIDWITYCLRRFSLPYSFDRPPKDNGLTYVRVTGGLAQKLRFLQLADPATSRKRSIQGTALKSTAKLGIKAIEPLGRRVRMFDITTGTGDFIANGVVSHNCFARNTHTYLDLNAGRDFEREIVVKVNVPELLRAELSRPSWKRELVAFGTNTDPYQWAEGKYELMPPMIEALRGSETPTSILTKSPLVVRDLDALVELAEVADVSVNLSVPTLDEKIWRQTEPHTPHPRKRLEAVAKFNEAGIPSGVLVAPLMPGINDSPELVEEIVSLAEEAGATFVNGIALHLRPGVKEVFMSWLSAARPDLVPRYERLYDGRAYAPNAERKRIGALIRAPNRSTDPRYRRRDQLAERRRRRAAEAEAESSQNAQTTLF